MTTKERLHEIIDELDSVRAEGLLVVLEPSNGEFNGHHVATDWTASHDAEWLALIRTAQATSPDERTPFQDGLVEQAVREAELVKTPKGRAHLERNRQDRERLHNAPPITVDDPIWNIVGMIKRQPGEPLTNVAENHDEYLAEAYVDLHDDDDRL